MADTKDIVGEGRPLRISITVNNHYTFDTDVATGKQIKATANIPAGFALYRRAHGGNEPIPDDAPVELRNGDHFFARPLSKSHDRGRLRAGHHGGDEPLTSR
jgi:hypothetical protein